LYGFHGTSHYVSRKKAIDYLEKVQKSVSIWAMVVALRQFMKLNIRPHSMGFSSNGLIMGTKKRRYEPLSYGHCGGEYYSSVV
jgi:acetate kinase